MRDHRMLSTLGLSTAVLLGMALLVLALVTAGVPVPSLLPHPVGPVRP